MCLCHEGHVTPCMIRNHSLCHEGHVTPYQEKGPLDTSLTPHYSLPDTPLVLKDPCPFFLIKGGQGEGVGGGGWGPGREVGGESATYRCLVTLPSAPHLQANVHSKCSSNFELFRIVGELILSNKRID
eukprot:1154951-Pelagomonas_calceolata.AAC.3